MFDASSIIAGLLVSSIGFVLFSYGKKMSRPPHMISGLVLMVFPYFIPGLRKLTRTQRPRRATRRLAPRFPRLLTETIFVVGTAGAGLE